MLLNFRRTSPTNRIKNYVLSLRTLCDSGSTFVRQLFTYGVSVFHIRCSITINSILFGSTPMKILSSADIHINLHKKKDKVPYKWQKDRFMLLFDKLLELEKDCDVHIISGDVFDKSPQTDEIAIFLSYINRVTIPTYIIDGNHEATSKGKTFLSFFAEQHTVSNKNVTFITENTNMEIMGQMFQFFPYTAVSKNNFPEPIQDSILVTHIRGDVPPHIKAEVDLEKLRPWKLILLGDLHYRHKHEPYDMYYPGSPLNTNFDREDNKCYGVDIFSFDDINSFSVDFVDLKLPKLLRHTIGPGEEMIEDGYNHIMYEVKGSIDELAKVGQHKLLDKRIVEKSTADSTLDLKDKSIPEELKIYLKYAKVTDIDKVMSVFGGLIIE